MDSMIAAVPGVADTGFPRGDTLTALVTNWVRTTPDALALVDGEVRLTYAELDRAADVTAGLLYRRGVRPGDRVPVLLPRGAAFVVTALAVLRLGAAYAGVDREWPAHRLRRVLDLLDCPGVVGGPVAADVLGPDRWLVAGPDPVAFARRPPSPVPRPDVLGTDACVVTFTSGTTGDPKCIPLPHRGVVRLVDVTPLPPPGPAPVALHSCALPWDASLLDIWGALARGGTCVVLREPYLTPAALRAAVHEQGVDTIMTPTSVFHLLVDEDVHCFAGLRTVQTGGEPLSPVRAGAFLAAHPETALVNVYGPSEASVVTTARRVVPEDCVDPAGVPVGTPIAHTGLHIRAGDRWCAPGEPGELLITGPGLALGYLGGPDSAFTEVVLPDGRRERAYRTGDLVRMTEEGLLYCLGRRDRQVKVRGLRVEPAEVERVAAAHAGVASCVVLPRPHPAGGYRDLALFYVGNADDLRTYLAERLPAHLVPATVVAVARYPLTAVGKIDADALLALTAGPAGDAVAEQPLDGTGELVRATFAEVLGVATVPADEPVFALGGTSLDVARICARLGDRTGVAVPPSRVIRTPTVRGLADWLAQAARPATVTPAEGPVELTGTQTGFVLLHDWNPADPGPLCPTVWTVTGGLDLAALRLAVADLHERHSALRHTYRLVAGRGVAEPAGVPAPEPAHLPKAPDRKAALVALTTALTTPLDPPNGVVWRVAVAPSADAATLLGVCVHHVAYDGWSHSVLVADLATAYSARHGGEPPVFDAPAVGLAEQNAGITGDATDPDRQRTEITMELRGVPELPLPRPTGTVAGPGVLAEVRELPRRVLAGVAEAARTAGVAPLAVWLSVYAESLAELTGAGDFGVGVPVVRRTGAALASCVGCAIGTVCVRLRPGEDASLASTGAAVRTALSCQDVPFDEVVRLVNPRRTARPPLYQTVFALQNVPYQELALPGTTVHRHLTPLLPPMLELETEVWIRDTDQIHLVVNADPNAVAESFVTGLADDLATRLAALGPT